MSSGQVFILVLMVAFLLYFIRRMVTGRSSQTSTKDWLLYFLIAPLMIAAFLGVFFYADSIGIHEEVSVKWMNISITAAFVFGYSAKEFWQYCRRWTFWVELGVLVVAHFALLGRLEWEKANYFWLPIVIGVPEAVVVYFLLGLMFEPDPDLSSDDLPK